MPDADRGDKPGLSGSLSFFGAGCQELVCRADRLAFPVRDGIPLMLEAEARALEPGEEPGTPR